MFPVMKHLCEEHSITRMAEAEASLIGYTDLADLHWCWLWCWLGHRLLYSVVVYGFYGNLQIIVSGVH